MTRPAPDQGAQAFYVSLPTPRLRSQSLKAALNAFVAAELPFSARSPYADRKALNTLSYDATYSAALADVNPISGRRHCDPG